MANNAMNLKSVNEWTHKFNSPAVQLKADAWFIAENILSF